MEIVKIRTRAHIVGDLGYNHVERQVLLADYVMTQVPKDYGHDGIITTFDDNGFLEYQYIFVQVKSTEKIKFSIKHQGYELSLSKKDLNNWVNYHAVSIVVFCNIPEKIAYYVHIQAYFKKRKIKLKEINKYLNIFIPKENVFDAKAVKKLRIIKNLIT